MFFLQPAESSKDLGVRELLVFCYMGSVELPFIGTPSKQTLGFVFNFFLFFGGGFEKTKLSMLLFCVLSGSRN